MMHIANAIKADVGDILLRTINGTAKQYRYGDDGEHIRWGLVQQDIDVAIDRHLMMVKKPTSEGDSSDE